MPLTIRVRKRARRASRTDAFRVRAVAENVPILRVSLEAGRLDLHCEVDVIRSECLAGRNRLSGECRGGEDGVGDADGDGLVRARDCCLVEGDGVRDGARPEEDGGVQGIALSDGFRQEEARIEVKTYTGD